MKSKKIEALKRGLIKARVKHHFITDSSQDYQLQTMLEKGTKIKNDWLGLKHIDEEILKEVIEEFCE